MSGNHLFLISVAKPCMRYPLNNTSSNAAWNGINRIEIRVRTIIEEVLGVRTKFEGSNLRYTNKYKAESSSHTNPEIRNLFHLIFLSPLIVILNVLLFSGLIKRMNAMRPAIKGKTSNKNPRFASSPVILRLFGFDANCEKTAGSEFDFIARATTSGIEPIVFDTIRIVANITRYLHQLFFPLNADSRWYMNNVF